MCIRDSLLLTQLLSVLHPPVESKLYSRRSTLGLLQTSHSFGATTLSWTKGPFAAVTLIGSGGLYFRTGPEAAFPYENGVCGIALDAPAAFQKNRPNAIGLVERRRGKTPAPAQIQ